MHEYTLIRSRRRSLSLSLDGNCRVIVRAPVEAPVCVIDDFVERHSGWIERKLPEARARMERARSITPELLDGLTERAKREIPPRVERYAAIMGVRPTGVRITRARRQFGSCSAKNSLCFSCLLMQYPDEAIDAVVVHELAHIAHHDHSAAFYDFVLRTMPDYREREKLLKHASPDSL